MENIIAFDFDGTLTVEDSGGRFLRWNTRMMDRLRYHAAIGHAVIIVTGRHGEARDRELSAAGYEELQGFPLVHAAVEKFHLPVVGIIFTDGALKGPVLLSLEVSMLYDDQVEQRMSAVEYGVRARLPVQAEPQLKKT
jgi:hypothetical protein